MSQCDPAKTPAPEPPQAEIPAHMELLHRELIGAEEELNMLIDELGAVLGELPEEEVEAGKALEVSCGLSDDIATARRRADRIGVAVRMTRRRLRL